MKIIPYSLCTIFARYPYEVHILSKRHAGALTDFTDAEQLDLAAILAINRII